MVQNICKDLFLLRQKASPAGPEQISAADDLKDTLIHNRERCVGMAANMIGKPTAVIVFFDGPKLMEMFNPEILSKDGRYETEEGCLSLEGTRKCTRWKKIKVRWQTRELQFRVKTFEGWTAEIIQHEIDHLDGVII